MLAPAEGIENYFAIRPEGPFHSIPSTVQCNECHKGSGDKILGFESLQLSHDRDPLGLHSSPSSTTILELLEKGILLNYKMQTPPRIHSSSDVGRASMGYLHGNCGHCHNPEGSANFTGLEFKHLSQSENENEEVAYRTSVNQRTTQFLIENEDPTYRVVPGNAEKSAIYYRLKTGTMPSLNHSLIDVDAVAQLREWIESITTH